MDLDEFEHGKNNPELSINDEDIQEPDFAPPGIEDPFASEEIAPIEEKEVKFALIIENPNFQNKQKSEEKKEFKEDNQKNEFFTFLKTMDLDPQDTTEVLDNKISAIKGSKIPLIASKLIIQFLICHRYNRKAKRQVDLYVLDKQKGRE